jgi:hypothetical protein
MAKSQHLAKLKLGTATWNHWRERNPQLGSGPQGGEPHRGKTQQGEPLPGKGLENEYVRESAMGLGDWF